MNRFFILIASAVLSLPVLAEEGKAVARVQQGIFETGIRWNEELRLCKSEAVLASAAEISEMEVSEFGKKVSLQGQAESAEIAIRVEHDDAANALAGMIRRDYEKARTEIELGLLKEAHALELESRNLESLLQKLDFEYLRVISVMNQRILAKKLREKTEGEDILILYFDQVNRDEEFLAAKSKYHEGKSELNTTFGKLIAESQRLDTFRAHPHKLESLSSLQQRLSCHQITPATRVFEIEANHFKFVSFDESEEEAANADQMEYRRALEAFYLSDPVIQNQIAIVSMWKNELIKEVWSGDEVHHSDRYLSAKEEYLKAGVTLRKLKKERAELFERK